METSNSSSLTPSNSRPLHLQTPPFCLPDGWDVEEIPRSYGSKSDKYYIEPETGKRFRSLREVERHLKGETVTGRQKSSELIASNPPEQIEEWVVRPPSKVKWGLASAKGDAWNPIVGDTLISDAVKQQWRKRFVSAMNNESFAVMPTERPPQLTEQPPQIAENIQQTRSLEGGKQDEGGLRRSSRTKKVANHHHDFIYH